MTLSFLSARANLNFDGKYIDFSNGRSKNCPSRPIDRFPSSATLTLTESVFPSTSCVLMSFFNLREALLIQAHEILETDCSCHESPEDLPNVVTTCILPWWIVIPDWIQLAVAHISDLVNVAAMSFENYNLPIERYHSVSEMEKKYWRISEYSTPLINFPNC